MMSRSMWCGSGRDSTPKVFPGQMSGPLRRGNFNKMSGWPRVVRAIGMEALHFHDLRHAGNHVPAASGAGLKDLMAHGEDSDRIRTPIPIESVQRFRGFRTPGGVAVR
jgi:hypothetical protein